jgi:hypothetical protein
MMDQLVVADRIQRMLINYGYELFHSQNGGLQFVSMPIARLVSNFGGEFPANTLIGKISFDWLPVGKGIKYSVRGVVCPPFGIPLFVKTMHHKPGDWMEVERLILGEMAPYLAGVTNVDDIKNAFREYY